MVNYSCERCLANFAKHILRDKYGNLDLTTQIRNLSLTASFAKSLRLHNVNREIKPEPRVADIIVG